MFAWILNKLKGDKIIWILIFLLSLVSIVAVYSASSSLAFRMKAGNTESYLFRHTLLLILGVLIVYVVHLINYRIFARITNTLLLISVPLLMYTVVSGREVNEASRWINVFGQSFQPSDLAKIALIMYLAKLLTLRQGVIKDFTEGFLPAIFWVCIICGLIAPTNLSTAMVLFTASLVVMFISGVEIKYIGLLLVIGLFGIMLLFSTAKRATTWSSRLKAYKEQLVAHEDGTYEGSYQALQSNIAVATGGFFGKGAGRSVQRNYLPLAFSDFIFAIIIEEYGLLGGIVVLCLYLTLLFRTVMIVTVSKTYGALVASGLAFMMVLQAFINMGVTVGLLPVTGLTLPWISMGGTSIFFTGFSLGLILSVSRDAMENKLNNNMKVDPNKIIRT